MCFVGRNCSEYMIAHRALDHLHFGSPNLSSLITTTGFSNAILMIGVPHESRHMDHVRASHGQATSVPANNDIMFVIPSVASTVEVLHPGRRSTPPPSWHVPPQDMSTLLHVPQSLAVPERRERNFEITCIKHFLHVLFCMRLKGRRNRVAHRLLLGNADEAAQRVLSQKLI